MDKSHKSYRKLLIWQKLQNLLLTTYRLVDLLPRTEDFGLKSQMKRAVVSVLSNFVEGYLKRSSKEKLHYLEIAETSLMELEAQGEICRMLTYWSEKDYEEFESSRSLAGYFLHQYKKSLSSS